MSFMFAGEGKGIARPGANKAMQTNAPYYSDAHSFINLILHVGFFFCRV
jgi:hypothetical protein